MPGEARATEMRTVRARRRGALSTVAVLAIVGGLTLIGTRASAALLDVPENGMAGRLTLSADAGLALLDVSPGAPGHWLITADLADVDQATLGVRIRSGGPLADLDSGLLVQLDRCDQDWIPVAPGGAPVCPDGAGSVLPPTPLRAFRVMSPTMELPDITARAGEHLLLTASVDAAQSNDAEVMDREGTIAVGLVAEGEDPDDVPTDVSSVEDPTTAGSMPGGGLGGLLPRTGAAIDVVALGLVGVGALGLGLLARRPARRRRREHRADAAIPEPGA